MSDTPTKSPRLTPTQLDFLKDAEKWTDHPDTDGRGARGSARRTASRLEDLGLVAYVGEGSCIDDNADDGEYPIYAITPAGRAHLHPVIADLLDDADSAGAER